MVQNPSCAHVHPALRSSLCPLILSPPPCWTMGGKLSASTMTSRRGSDEFFFDDFRQQWRWHWKDTWWTFEPFFDDDPEFGMLRKGACWVSDCGRIWHGPDPEEWCRQHRRRQANRRWLREERSRCKSTAMSLRRTIVPAALTTDILGWAFDRDTIKDAIR